MRNRDVLFSDRRDAGRQLAARLLAMGLTRPVVLALPRGGIPVAFEIARALGAPLGIVLVRKIGTPWSKEVAIGALAEVRRQHRVMSPSARQYAGAWLDEQIQVLQQEMACRRALYAADDGSLVPPLDGATAIIVDDGIATGNTMRAALAAVAEEHPARVLFAAPVGAPDMVQALQAQAEGLCLAAPDDFHAVSPYYTDFTQTTDEEVVRLLAQSRAGLAATQKESRMKKISDLMTRDVATVSPQDSLQRAAQLMKECDVGALPVCDGQTLVGMITDRDITVRASADGQAPDNVKVGEVMSEGITYCFEDQDVEEVLQQMGTEQVRRLPVLTRDKRLCGMVALGDIATRDQTHTDSALEGISQPPAGGQQGAQGESPSRPS